MNLSALPVIKLPIVDVTTNPLDLLLTALTLRMKQLARTSPKFVELIHDRKFRLEIASADGISRQIIVDHGKISGESSKEQPADLKLTFKDTDYAVKTLLKGDSSAFMTGMKAGDITIEGDFGLLVWFNQATKLLAPKLPKNVSTKIKSIRKLIKQKTGK